MNHLDLKESLEFAFACRQHLHMYPELSEQETNTQAFIIEKLKSLGISYEIFETSVIARVFKDSSDGVSQGAFDSSCDEVQSSSPSIGLRADMDALPILEDSNLAFRSKNIGVMHACGHDGHMAMLLGTLHFISKHKNLLSDDVVAVFQQAEEGPGGAEKLVKAGFLQKHNIKKCMGFTFCRA